MCKPSRPHVKFSLWHSRDPVIRGTFFVCVHLLKIEDSDRPQGKATKAIFAAISKRFEVSRGGPRHKFINTNLGCTTDSVFREKTCFAHVFKAEPCKYGRGNAECYCALPREISILGRLRDDKQSVSRGQSRRRLGLYFGIHRLKWEWGCRSVDC